MTLAHTSRGSGPSCYLLPANGHDARDFAAVRPTLATRFETVALDWPAMGSSPAPADPAAMSAAAFADELETFVLARGSEPAVFIGHSVGGYAAGRLALRRPELVRALVLVNSGGFFDPGPLGRFFSRLRGHPGVIRATEGAFARYHTKRRNPHTAAMFERIDAARRGDAYAAVVAGVWNSFASRSFDLRPLGTIRCPTLLVWGARDPIVTLQQAGRGAERAIPGSHLVSLDTGHSPFAEDPEGFLASVMPFLERVIAEPGNARDAAAGT
ncbi:MAG TPA: alpha/beta hydrolase [Polyangiales bacterium]|nr:alpha/beta hydrolase [Polyangiales bacterium]